MIDFSKFQIKNKTKRRDSLMHFSLLPERLWKIICLFKRRRGNGSHYAKSMYAVLVMIGVLCAGDIWGYCLSKNAILYYKSLLIKSAYASDDNEITIEISGDGSALSDDFWDEPEWAQKGCEATGGTWNGTSCICSGEKKQYCRAWGFNGCINSALCTIGTKRCKNKRIAEVCTPGFGSLCPTTSWTFAANCDPCQDCVEGECQDKPNKEKCECEGNGEPDILGRPYYTGKTFCSSGNCCEKNQVCSAGHCCGAEEEWVEDK